MNDLSCGFMLIELSIFQPRQRHGQQIFISSLTGRTVMAGIAICAGCR